MTGSVSPIMAATGALAKANLPTNLVLPMILGIFQNNAAPLSKRNVQSKVDKLTRKVSQPLGNNGVKQREPPTPPPPKNILVRLYQRWYGLPQIFRFFVGGNLGNLAFFYTDQFLFEFLSTNPHNFFSLDFLDKHLAGLSFFTAYLLQIVTTHLLFAFLVYGLDTINTPEKYFKTLWGQFRVYAFSLIGSTALNTYLINSWKVEKTYAFFSTMAVFAIINYFWISWMVERAVKSAELHEAELQKQKKRSVKLQRKAERVVKKADKAVTGWFASIRGGDTQAVEEPSLQRRADTEFSFNEGRIRDFVLNTSRPISVAFVNTRRCR